MASHLVLLVLSAVVSFSGAVIAPYKGFSGFRLRNDSYRIIYYYEQTVGVVELGPKRQLFNCEFIEVNETPVQKALLKNLTETVGNPNKISFKSMLDLMKRCDELVPPVAPGTSEEVSHHPIADSVLNGVLPGTKWCGNGDLASTYFDLGMERSDVCCRRHDLCPIKVKQQSTRYGITNKSFSMSHCDCDKEFSKCLKSINSTIANAMGFVYFDVLKYPCLEGSVSKGFVFKRTLVY